MVRCTAPHRVPPFGPVPGFGSRVADQFHPQLVAVGRTLQEQSAQLLLLYTAGNGLIALTAVRQHGAQFLGSLVVIPGLHLRFSYGCSQYRAEP